MTTPRTRAGWLSGAIAAAAIAMALGPGIYSHAAAAGAPEPLGELAALALTWLTASRMSGWRGG